jgi:peptidoglycan/xylan/chitin deacetylase (PgdA/CDA1 family)
MNTATDPVIRVLLYHHVGPVRPGTYPTLTVTPSVFAEQMMWLRRHGYQSIRLSDWPDRLPEKPLLITFDDGYADIVDHAFPILEENHFTATVFLVTSCIGGLNEWDRETSYSLLPLMTRPDIESWSQRGIDFGSHSRTHPSLIAVTDDILRAEIEGSWEDLCRLLPHPACAFSYPYGDFNDAVAAVARKTYRFSFTIEGGNNTLSADRSRLRRAWVKPSDGKVGFPLRVIRGKNPLDRFLKPEKNGIAAPRI